MTAEELAEIPSALEAREVARVLMDQLTAQQVPLQDLAPRLKKLCLYVLRPVAQLVERAAHNGTAVGSNPTGATTDAQAQRIAELTHAMAKSNDEITQVLGRALKYPWFKDDQNNFPGATEENGVCVGDHVAESLADEAAKRIAELEAQLATAQAEKLQENTAHHGAATEGVAGIGVGHNGSLSPVAPAQAVTLTEEEKAVFRDAKIWVNLQGINPARPMVRQLTDIIDRLTQATAAGAQGAEQ